MITVVEKVRFYETDIDKLAEYLAMPGIDLFALLETGADFRRRYPKVKSRRKMRVLRVLHLTFCPIKAPGRCRYHRHRPLISTSLAGQC